MARAVTRTDILWGYIAQALNIGAGLILLPVILHSLTPEDVGLWFVFITLASLAQLLEFGFQPTLARNTAYVYAGALTLTKQGLPADISINREVDYRLMAEIIAVSRRIYKIVSLVAALALFLGGSIYIHTLLTPTQNSIFSLTAWIMFAAGYVATFYYGYFNGLLQGRGDVTAANKVVVITRGTLVVLGAMSVMLGYGLLGLGASSLSSCIVGRWFARRFFYTKLPKELHETELSTPSSPDLIKILWHNASRSGAVQFGAFLIQRANILIASSFLGLTAAASYSMTITVLMALSSVAQVICQVQLPHMNALQATGNRQELRAVYGAILLVAWGVFLTGAVAIGLWGDELLVLIKSKTTLLPSDTFAVISCVLFLEVNHSLAATYLTTKNYVPFVRAALYSGLTILLLSLIGVNIYGLWGLIIAQGAVQLVYNNWKWPHEANRHLSVNMISLLNLGVKKIARTA